MLCLFIEDVDDTVDVDPPDPAGGLTVGLCYKKKIIIFYPKNGIFSFYYSDLSSNIILTITNCCSSCRCFRRSRFC